MPGLLLEPIWCRNNPKSAMKTVASLKTSLMHLGCMIEKKHSLAHGHKYWVPAENDHYTIQSVHFMSFWNIVMLLLIYFKYQSLRFFHSFTGQIVWCFSHHCPKFTFIFSLVLSFFFILAQIQIVTEVFWVVVSILTDTTWQLIIIISRWYHGYPWPSLATPPYRSSP